jgi:assimilatory nitrate reductase catalytic subunit
MAHTGTCHRPVRAAPHLPGRATRLDTGVEPDRLVKTHCCFCGQQCGIQLKVKDNEVIGFEPWDDFPFNRGCSAPRASSATCRGRIPTGC